MARKVITPEATFSYPHLFRPQAAQEGGKEKYSLTLVFDEGADLKELKAAAVEAAQEKWGDKAKSMIQKGQLRFPFRDDGEEKGYPEGSIFINARSDRRPGVVSIIPDPQTGKPMVIDDEEQIYPGVIGRASLTAFGYDVSGNKGVSFALNNVQKIRDGERLDGKVKAEDEFEADASAAASLEDLVDESAQDDEEPKAKKGKGKKSEEDLAALLA